MGATPAEVATVAARLRDEGGRADRSRVAALLKWAIEKRQPSRLKLGSE